MQGDWRKRVIFNEKCVSIMQDLQIMIIYLITGKLYAVLGKRGGRVLHGDLACEGSTSFEVTAMLPVVDSFDFANEVRRQTSGLALPQLVFSGWEVSYFIIITVWLLGMIISRANSSKDKD